MNPNWQSFLTAAGGRLNADTNEVTDFGQAAEELRAAATETILAPLTHLGLIGCSGDDACSYLHNQLSNDLKHLTPAQAQHSAWCTAQGRMVATFIVWQQGDAYQLVISADLAAPVIQRFKKYVMRSKVTLEDLSESRVLLGLAGPEAPAALAIAGLPVPAAALDHADAAGATAIRFDANRFLLAFDYSEAMQKWPLLAAKARPVGVPVWRWLDVGAALPWVSAATCEEFVPQMADFEKIGVSFHKGCYPGQEIVARARYLGKVKRHLFRVSSSVALQAGDNLHSPEHPGQAIGKIVSVAPAPEGGFVALAVILSSYAESAHVGSEDGPLIKAEAVHPCV